MFTENQLKQYATTALEMIDEGDLANSLMSAYACTMFHPDVLIIFNTQKAKTRNEYQEKSEAMKTALGELDENACPHSNFNYISKRMGDTNQQLINGFRAITEGLEPGIEWWSHLNSIHFDIVKEIDPDNGWDHYQGGKAFVWLTFMCFPILDLYQAFLEENSGVQSQINQTPKLNLDNVNNFVDKIEAWTNIWIAIGQWMKVDQSVLAQTRKEYFESLVEKLHLTWNDEYLTTNPIDFTLSLYSEGNFENLPHGVSGLIAYLKEECLSLYD